MGSLSKPYKTGTISISANGKVVTGNGTLWSTQAEEGDYIFANGHVGFITSNIGDATLELEMPWTGGELVNQPYRLMKMSWLRYEPAITQQKVRELILMLEAQGSFLFVAGAAPDEGVGEDGQFAFKVNAAPWRVWYKQNGNWILQGSPAGFVWKGLWAADGNYLANDQVHWLGNSWVSKTTNTNKPPDSNPSDWDLYVAGGTRYDLIWYDNGRPIDSEVLVEAPFALQVQFPANMQGSVGKASVAATANAVFSIQKNGVQFATMTFAAGSTSATFAGTATSFVSGDELKVVAPSSQDATLSQVRATFTGYR